MSSWIPARELGVVVPYHITSDLIKAVRENDLTRCEDKDEMNLRIGWLICAWGVIVDKVTSPPEPPEGEDD